MRAKLSDINSLVTTAVVGLVAYLLYKALTKVTQTVEQVYSDARTGTTNLIETFFPLVDPDSLYTYAVTFPDGKRHAVPGESVSRGGYFTYGGVRYRLMTNSAGFKIATQI